MTITHVAHLTITIIVVPTTATHTVTYIVHFALATPAGAFHAGPIEQHEPTPTTQTPIGITLQTSKPTLKTTYIIIIIIIIVIV
jgi:hypothetical protein